MREVRIHSRVFTDAQLLHDDEAQTVDGAVGLILVSLEVGEQMIDEPQVLEGSEGFDDARMVGVSLRDEREEESRVEEDHTFG